jgi:hypothetical protein
MKTQQQQQQQQNKKILKKKRKYPKVKLKDLFGFEVVITNQIIFSILLPILIEKSKSVFFNLFLSLPPFSLSLFLSLFPFHLLFLLRHLKANDNFH